MLISFFRYLKGYVRIRLQGYSPERFLNLCRAREIEIWDLKSCGLTYEMNLGLRDFRKLKPLRKKARAHVVILERHGLPFFLYRNRNRKMFPAGILLCAIFLYVMSLYIWNIHIEGNYSRTTDVILDYLESEQVVHGMRKSQVDCKEIQSMIRIEFPDIIWVSAEVKGTRLIIRVRENMDTEVQEDTGGQTEASDLTASRPGLITSVLVRSGKALVQPGDEVEEGAILVSGRIDILSDYGEVLGYQYTAADADVYARTEYEYYDEFLLSHEERHFTGKKRHGFYLILGNRRLAFEKKPGFAAYTTLSTEHPLKLTENFYLPVTLGTISYEEYETYMENYTTEEARLLAETDLNEFLENLIEKGVQIVENNVKIEVGNNTCRAAGTIAALEEIGTAVPTEILEDPVQDTAGEEK